MTNYQEQLLINARFSVRELNNRAAIENIIDLLGDVLQEPTPIVSKVKSVENLRNDYKLELEKNKELADTCARLAFENSTLRDQLKEISVVLSRKVVELEDFKEPTGDSDATLPNWEGAKTRPKE